MKRKNMSLKEIRELSDSAPKSTKTVITIGDKIRESNDSLAEALDKMLNEDRDDWEPMGCRSCANVGTHHADKSLIGTDEEYLYECKGCDFEHGILNYLNKPYKEDKK